MPRAVATRGTSKWFLSPRSSRGDEGGSASLALSREVSGAAGCVHDLQEELGSHCKVRGGRDEKNTGAAHGQDIASSEGEGGGKDF